MIEVEPLAPRLAARHVVASAKGGTVADALARLAYIAEIAADDFRAVPGIAAMAAGDIKASA